MPEIHPRSSAGTADHGDKPDNRKVVICGGGPVGLALALALAKLGVPSLVVEADAGICDGSRAICLSRRSLEILARLGVLEPFLAKGLPWTGGRSFHREAEVLRFVMPHDGDQRLPPMVNIPQFFVEQFLVDAIARHPDLITLAWNTRLTGVAQGDGEVRLSLESDGVQQMVAAGWLVACDGARSAVRQSLGLRMQGTAYEARYVIVDIKIALDWPTERLAWFDPPSNPGRTMLMHRQPGDVWRLDYQLHDGEDAAAMIAPDKVAAVVEKHMAMLGVDAPWELVWASSYRASALSLDDYRHGRVLFAGDAAHLLPIFGVRGLNSGVDDAFNLAWKLALVVQGKAGEALLDSYSQERRAAWVENRRQSMKSTAFMAPPSRGYEVMREAVLALARRNPEVRALINPRQTSAIAYGDSALNGHGSDIGFGGGPALGEVVPECPLRDAAGAATHLTTLLETRFTLLAYHEAAGLADMARLAEQAARRHGLPLALLGILAQGSVEPHASPPDPALFARDEDARFARRFDARPGSAWLLRPDGHVCGRWRTPSLQDIDAALVQALALTSAERQAA